VSDLDNLLMASGERPPYVLVGHSNGGQIIGTYAGQHPESIAGLVFLDAFYRLPGQSLPSAKGNIGPNGVLALSLKEDLLRLRRCLWRAESNAAAMVPKAGDECLDSEELKDLPPSMAKARVAAMAKPAFWRSHLSEAECNYEVTVCNQGLRPIPADAWRKIPIRVIVAAISSLSDDESAKVYGLRAEDRQAIAQARESRRQWERSQSRICEFTADCRVERVTTGDHYVQNAAPDIVARVVTELITRQYF
jgi:pimeloyl-ACP methyl ester carboxylesterase